MEGSLALLFGVGGRGQQQRGENRNDGVDRDYDEQFNQFEGAGGGRSAIYILSVFICC